MICLSKKSSRARALGPSQDKHLAITSDAFKCRDDKERGAKATDTVSTLLLLQQLRNDGRNERERKEIDTE